MVDVNDIFSTLGNDHLLEAMKLQDVQPEKNMVSIEDVSQTNQIAVQPKTTTIKAQQNPKVLKNNDSNNQ